MIVRRDGFQPAAKDTQSSVEDLDSEVMRLAEENEALQTERDSLSSGVASLEQAISYYQKTGDLPSRPDYDPKVSALADKVYSLMIARREDSPKGARDLYERAKSQFMNEDTYSAIATFKQAYAATRIPWYSRLFVSPDKHLRGEILIELGKVEQKIHKPGQALLCAVEALKYISADARLRSDAASLLEHVAGAMFAGERLCLPAYALSNKIHGRPYDEKALAQLPSLVRSVRWSSGILNWMSYC